jgi:hypothetical protein
MKTFYAILLTSIRKNPTLAFGGLKEVNGGDNSFNVGGMFPLDLYGRRTRRTEVAQNKEDATQQSVADRERLLTGEVRTRFGEALASIRNLMSHTYARCGRNASRSQPHRSYAHRLSGEGRGCLTCS